MVDVEGRLGTITLARVARRNAITPPMLAGIIEACGAVAAAAVDVVCLRGAGPDFSVGFDLDQFATGSTDGAVLGGQAVAALRDLEAVTVAVLQGWVVGGGMALAGACDLRVATTDTRFRIPEVPLGIPLGWGALPVLVEEVGLAVTRDLVMTGRVLDAGQALAVGFVARVGDGADLIDQLLATPAGPLRTTKRQLRAVTGSSHSGEDDAELLIAAVSDPGFAEAFARYRASLS